MGGSLPSSSRKTTDPELPPFLPQQCIHLTSLPPSGCKVWVHCYCGKHAHGYTRVCKHTARELYKIWQVQPCKLTTLQLGCNQGGYYHTGVPLSLLLSNQAKRLPQSLDHALQIACNCPIPMQCSCPHVI